MFGRGGGGGCVLPSVKVQQLCLFLLGKVGSRCNTRGGDMGSSLLAGMWGYHAGSVVLCSVYNKDQVMSHHLETVM